MKSRDWLIVGLRLFGVWELLQGLSEAVWACWVRYRMITTHTTSESAYWFHTAVYFIAGSILLFTAPLLAGLLDWQIPQKHLCEKCGYDLRASKTTCPECGTQIPQAVSDHLE